MTSGVVAIGDATLYRGDMRDVLCLLDPVDAIVTDPPYHLLQVSRGGSPRQNDPTKPFGRAEARSGFMGQVWDGGDVAFRPETWVTIGAALRPGGFLLAFGGTRTWHRMTCAIEDAGFVIQDTIAWLYGSGFPKNRAMLKPAFEPIILAYKPGGKRTMQVDECRIPGNNPSIQRREVARRTGNAPGRPGEYGATITDRITPEAYCADHEGETLGRWPANICHDGSDEVVAAFPETHGAGAARTGKFGGQYNATSYDMSGPREMGRFGDDGSAARFFYCAKANKTDRAGSRHPTVKPQALMRWLVQLVTPPGGIVLDPFGGSGSTAQAALATGRRCVLIEREENWFQDACLRVEFAQPVPDFRMAAE